MALTCGAVAAAACHPRPRVEHYEILISTTTDTGDAIGGAAIAINGKAIGETGPAGGLQLALDAPPGKVLRIVTTCPSGYRSPERETVVRLRRLSSLDSRGGDPLVVAEVCRPHQRAVAVIVNAPKAPGVPLLLHGRRIARTDDRGSAHTLLAMAPGTEFQLQLDTSSDPRLLPRNPTAKFTVGDADQVYVFDQTFEEKKKKRKIRKKKKPTGPVKIRSVHKKPWQR